MSSRALLLEGEPGGVPDPMLKIGESDRMGARQLGLEPREPRSTESMSADRNKIVLRLTFEAEMISFLPFASNVTFPELRFE